MKTNAKEFISSKGCDHLITISYIGPTDHKGSRVCLKSERFPGDKLVLGMNHEFRDILEQGLETLFDLDYYPISYGSMHNGGYWVTVSELKPLKDAKRANP